MSEGAFECKVSAKRETGAGIFITLEIQPDDFTADLATLRVGSALQVGWAEIVDPSVQPIKVETPKPKRRSFDEMSLPEQAGVLCGEPQFWKFLESWSSAMWADESEWADNKHRAAEVVRRICGVQSRTELSHNEAASDKWRGIESEYRVWLTDQRYKDSVR